MSETKSDTPRTDGQINGTRFATLAGDCLRDALVPSEFARTLERENAALKAEIAAADLRLDRLMTPRGVSHKTLPDRLEVLFEEYDALKLHAEAMYAALDGSHRTTDLLLALKIQAEPTYFPTKDDRVWPKIVAANKALTNYRAAFPTKEA